HPTQFYPGAVLGIISDLNQAIARNNLKNIRSYLEQLGKTPFFKRKNLLPMMKLSALYGTSKISSTILYPPFMRRYTGHWVKMRMRSLVITHFCNWVSGRGATGTAIP